MKRPVQKPIRSAGILLHPTSLPGPFGIGDLGPAAHAWIDALVRARQTWWQMLPLGPTGYGDSPYQSFSAFAGNPYLISPEALLQDGLLNRADLTTVDAPPGTVAFEQVIEQKNRVLTRAWENFQANSDSPHRSRFQKFCAQHASWLDDFALFMALKSTHGGVSWLEWPREFVRREAAALKQASKDLDATLDLHRFIQYLFFRQWNQLKTYANSKGIKLIGDVPIFVSSDSADVWSNPELFHLDKERRPRAVSGVPPDYFSKTGQLWGNPLYNWKALKQARYKWWAARLGAALELVDLIRLDHFRGFQAYWQVPAGEATAERGKWVRGPGADLFEALRRALGKLPLIAEDLGDITPVVDALRERFHLPGMRILQFAFGGATEPRFMPHNYDRNTVVYTGTHDNDTTRGWYNSLSEPERHYLRRYLARDGSNVSWDLIRLAWSSVADYALTPLQDVLDLGTEARMNLPGRPSGNWRWRFTNEMLTDAALDRLGDMTKLYER